MQAAAAGVEEVTSSNAVASKHIDTARAEVTRRIKHLGKQGKPKQAINELTNLVKLGIQPNTVTATALVSACATNGNMDMALNVFDELFGATALCCMCLLFSTHSCFDVAVRGALQIGVARFAP